MKHNGLVWILDMFAVETTALEPLCSTTTPAHLPASLSECKLGNVNRANSPGLAAIGSRHLAGDALALPVGVSVVRVRLVQDNLGVDPGWVQCMLAVPSEY
jgi:hypothetical protein